jgi:hypothetical protein
LERVEHRTTHRDIVFHVHRPAEDRSKSTFDDACLSVLGYPRLRWHPVDRLDELGLSNPHRKMIDSAAGEQTSE